MSKNRKCRLGEQRQTVVALLRLFVSHIIIVRVLQVYSM